MNPEKKSFLVLFGSTGDLAQKKVLPSLFHLHKTLQIPKNFSVIAIGRTEHTNESYREFVSHHIERVLGEEVTSEFLSLFEYVSGNIHADELYQKIENTAVRLGLTTTDFVALYFSVGADLYTDISSGITRLTSLTKRDKELGVVCIEKPLGSDLESAKKLDAELTTFFDETQLYRIEHYLAKPFIQHVPLFRFKEALYEDLFSHKFVDKIHVYFSEKMGVENRGPFYDAVGALRDVGQNHCLHMLASICAEKPEHDDLNSVIASRAQFLSQNLLATDESVGDSYRGQYDGYRIIEGVQKDSMTETSFKITTQLRGQRWLGVPVVLSGGKRMLEYKKGVEVFFKHNEKNIKSIYFESYPKVRTLVTFNDGTSHVGFSAAAPSVQYVGEYAAILHEVFQGKKMYSISEAEVEAMWKFVDPYCKGWAEDKAPLKSYIPESLSL